MTKKFTEEWFSDFCRKISEDKSYKADSRGWVWNVIFVIVGDENSANLKSGINATVRMKLREGKCEGIEIMKNENGNADEYVIKGKASAWERIIEGKISITNSLLRGDLRVTGDFRKLIEYILSANDLSRIAGTV